MRRRIAQAIGFGVALLACALAVQPAAGAAPRIVIATPHAWQVIQRDARGRADIVVSGRCVDLGGSVRVSWRGHHAVARCDRVGRFTVALQDVRAGQATLQVSSVQRPGLVCSRRDVGVGDVYVVAGQSNASGRSPVLFSYTSPTLRAAMFGNDYHWQELRDPVDSSVGQVDRVSTDHFAGGSVWPLVATDLLAAEGVPVAFIPCARSSTSIARWEWDLPARRPAGTLYTSMARRIAVSGGKVRAVLWWQGERDARDLTPGSRYETALRGLSSAVWRDFRAPLVVAQIGDYGGAYSDAAVDVVRLAQEQAWGAPHILQGPVLYDIDLHGEVHFREADDVAAAAHRWAAAILRSLFHLDAGRTPRLVQAVREGDEVVLTADFGLAPGADLGGFAVHADGREVPIASASADGDTVRLVLGEPAEGALQVSLGEGRSGAGADVPTDTSAWLLPMLPFVERPVQSGTQR